MAAAKKNTVKGSQTMMAWYFSSRKEIRITDLWKDDGGAASSIWARTAPIVK